MGDGYIGSEPGDLAVRNRGKPQMLIAAEI